tara:strand:+ start:636 stop:1199 length:564 start_codon:yes stop_codon:yes gene_type:complete
MSDKKDKTAAPLLQESTVRRFMALANVQGLTDRVVNEMYAPAGVDEEDRPEDELELGGDDLGDEELGGDDLGDEELGGEEGEDLEAEALPAEAKEALADVIADALEAAVADGTLEIEAGDVEGEGEELDLEDEGEPALEDEPDLEGGSEGPVDLGDEPLEEVTVVDDDAIINEVMRRVAKRLQTFKG